MPLSGSISISPQTVAATTPAQARGAPATYQPKHSDAGGPLAPTAPIPGVAPAPSRVALGQTQEGEEQVDTGQPAEGSDAWRLAQLAQKDKLARQRSEEARRMEARARAAQEEIRKQQEAFEARLQEFEQRQERWRRDPAALLRDNGFNPEAALQFMLNGEKLTPEQQAAALVDARLREAQRQQQAEAAALREELARNQKTAEEQRRRAEEAERNQEAEAAIADFKGEISEVIQADPEAYEILGQMGERGVNAVFDHIDKAFTETGKRMSVKQAAAEMENMAVEDAREWLGKSKKLAGLAGAPFRAAVPRTLTNRIAASPGPAPQPQPGETSAQQRDRVRAVVEAALRAGRIR